MPFLNICENEPFVHEETFMNLQHSSHNPRTVDMNDTYE